tara:strand:- start:301 stop:420 length:120 start_codon:yes stop_codon:yes gene_type:complete
MSSNYKNNGEHYKDKNYNNENYYWEQKAENFIKTGSYYG